MAPIRLSHHRPLRPAIRAHRQSNFIFFAQRIRICTVQETILETYLVLKRGRDRIQLADGRRIKIAERTAARRWLTCVCQKAANGLQRIADRRSSRIQARIATPNWPKMEFEATANRSFDEPHLEELRRSSFLLHFRLLKIFIDTIAPLNVRSNCFWSLFKIPEKWPIVWQDRCKALLSSFSPKKFSAKFSVSLQPMRNGLPSIREALELTEKKSKMSVTIKQPAPLLAQPALIR